MEAEQALHHLHAAYQCPPNLGEARHLLMNLSEVDYWLGVAEAAHRAEGTALVEAAGAAQHWERAARARGDFQQMRVQVVSEATYWSAQSLRRLGQDDEAAALFRQVQEYAVALEQQPAKIDYFATSLPTMLLFEEDLRARQTITARFLEAQALAGLGDHAGARRLLVGVLALDPSHTATIDLLALLDAGQA